MATYVEAEGLKVLIDPAWLSDRGGTGCRRILWNGRGCTKTWEDVKKYAAQSGLLIITHYHYDHHNPDELDFYRDKAVYLKDPKKNINKSQFARASHFLKGLQGLPRSIAAADGKEFQHGSATIKFSPPVYHGTSSRLGYVLEVSLSCKGEKLVFTSDVEGPSLKEQTDFILQEDPDLLI